MPKFSKLSQTRLATCHLDIQIVMEKAIKYYNFSVVCGHRSEQEQNKAYRQGFSKLIYPNSRHNKTPSTAIDIVPYPIDWHNINRFYQMAGVVLTIAKQSFIVLEWGGNWQTFKDYPHFQLKKK
jgi:peptidoglycan L-alanyl-D-glutamate endopeptidase CwlK